MHGRTDNPKSSLKNVPMFDYGGIKINSKGKMVFYNCILLVIESHCVKYVENYDFKKQVTSDNAFRVNTVLQYLFLLLKHNISISH